MGCRCAELHPRNFGLHHSQPDLFTKSQWRCHPIAYVAYRMAVAIYVCIWCVLSGLHYRDSFQHTSDRLKWFIYLTHWSYLVLVISSILRAIVSIVFYHKLRTSKGDYQFGRMACGLKLTWVVYNVSTMAALIVTLLYWSMVYKSGMTVSAGNINIHGINSVIVIVDFFITAIPIRIYHFIHTVIYAGIYFIFSWVYHWRGGTDKKGRPFIYPFLDWHQPSKALVYVFVGALVGIPLYWLLVYGFYQLRLWIFRTVYKVPATANTNTSATMQDPDIEGVVMH